MPGHRLGIGEHGDISYRARGERVTASLYYRNHEGRRRRIEATADTKTGARRKALAILQERMSLGCRHRIRRDHHLRRTWPRTGWLSCTSWLKQVVGRRALSPSTGMRSTVTCSPPWVPFGSRTSRRHASITSFTSSGERRGMRRAKLCRAVLSGVCGLAVRREGLRVNPVRDVSSLEAHGGREARALTIDEIHEWLAILDGSEFARRKDLPDLARFLLGTGCRLGEAVGVHWEDVDFERQLVHVRRTVLRVPGQGVIAKRPKSKAGQRSLRMPLWLVAVLRERRRGALDPDPRPRHPDRRRRQRRTPPRAQASTPPSATKAPATDPAHPAQGRSGPANVRVRAIPTS